METLLEQGSKLREGNEFTLKVVKKLQHVASNRDMDLELLITYCGYDDIAPEKVLEFMQWREYGGGSSSTS